MNTINRLKIDVLVSSIALHLFQYFQKEDIEYFIERVKEEIKTDTLPGFNDCITETEAMPIVTLFGSKRH
jgi:hypothetical protein